MLSNLFGSDDDNGNNFEIVKWPMPLDRALNILSYCIQMEFIGNVSVELCEDISTLPHVRSISGRSVPVILFGDNDDKVNN